MKEAKSQEVGTRSEVDARLISRRSLIKASWMVPVVAMVLPPRSVFAINSPSPCNYSSGYWFACQGQTLETIHEWPTNQVTIAGNTYTKEEALTILNSPSGGDKSVLMFRQLVAANLNTIANTQAYNSTVIYPDNPNLIQDAEAWLSTHPLYETNQWDGGELLHDQLDEYNSKYPYHCLT